MALIKCSECGKEISDKEEVCIHCGNPLQFKEEIAIITIGNLQFPYEDIVAIMNLAKVTKVEAIKKFNSISNLGLMGSKKIVEKLMNTELQKGLVLSSSGDTIHKGRGEGVYKAVIKCSECGKEISDKADVCIHCGRPVRLVNATTKNEETRKFVDNYQKEHHIAENQDYNVINDDKMTEFEDETKFNKKEKSDNTVFWVITIIIVVILMTAIGGGSGGSSSSGSSCVEMSNTYQKCKYSITEGRCICRMR